MSPRRRIRIRTRIHTRLNALNRQAEAWIVRRPHFFANHELVYVFKSSLGYPVNDTFISSKCLKHLKQRYDGKSEACDINEL